ncbi:MAG: DMT family transporter [Pseudomonadales bacterium]|nr:DMT family transporter [Pseudomonadales bacterium]
MADLLLLLVTLLSAAGWIFSKEALSGFPPLLFIGIRFLMAGLIIAAFSVPSLRNLSKRAIWDATKVGLVFALAIIFWINGLNSSHHLGEGAFLTSLAVVLIPVIAKFWFNEDPPTSTWFALPISLLGLGFISLNNLSSDIGFSIEPAQLLFLGAAIIFAVQFNLVTQVVARVPALPLTAIQLVVVGIVSLLISSVTESFPDTVPASIWGWLLASALISTSARFFVQTYAQGLTPASHAAVILTLEPVWTALAATIWFSESMSTFQMVGCGTIFLALIVSRWRWIADMIKHRH